MKYLLSVCLLAFSLVCCSSALAQQLTFGPTVGVLFDNPTGTVLVDSIRVTLQGDNDRQPYYGGYISYTLSPRFTFTSGISYGNSYTSATAYNTLKEPGLQRLIHATSARTASLEVPLLLETSLPVKHARVFVLTGVAPAFRITRSGQGYYRNRDMSEEMADVLYSFKKTMKPVVWKYAVGMGVTVGRFRAEARWQFDLSQSATNPYRLFGKTYDFNSRNNTIRFGLGYALQRNPGP
jgi:hypothetical protein